MVGLGLAAIRDMISYAKYDPSTPFPVDYAIAIGISQTGRFLRHFVYQGFNTDEQGRQALDGPMIHTAGAGSLGLDPAELSRARRALPGSFQFVA